MRIQNNITAMNTHRMYTTNNSAVAKSAEKLSSGYRINRAGDDAAGLAISEKMRSQIRGLNMASKNSQDAVSLIQTAEGALQEVHSMLQRMNELANQAATGTNQEFDREQINAEFNQLKDEINQIAETTQFNQMKLLDGSLASDAAKANVEVAKSGLAVGKTLAGPVTSTYTITKQTGLSDKVGTYGITVKSGSTITVTFTDAETGNTTNTDIDLAKVAKDLGAGKAFTLDLSEAGLGTYEVTANDDTNVSASDLASALAAASAANGGSAVKTSASVLSAADISGTVTTDPAAHGAVSFSFDDDAIKAAMDALGLAEGDYTMSLVASGANVNLVATGKDGTAHTLGSASVAPGATDASADFTAVAGAGGGKLGAMNVAGITVSGAGVLGTATNVAAKVLPATYGNIGTINSAGASTASKGGLKIQVGANEGEQLTISVASMNTKGLEIHNSSIGDQTKAGEAITATQKAVNLVSEQRATLGAMQNRLEHKIANLDNTSENLSAAESRIRDVDIAKEMTAFTKNNILSQAATAMLAQANAAPQGVLSLLQ